MRNHTPYHTAYTTVWRMILGRMHALKCKKKKKKKKKKISCKSLQKSIEAMVMKEKRLPQITLSLFDKGTNGRQKTYEIFHVYCIFYSGFMCQTKVIFGITKDGSLVYTLAS